MDIRANLRVLLFFAAFIAEGWGADAPEKTAARDYIYCSAWYSLAASSSSTVERKQNRTDWAVALGQYATILSDANFFASEYKDTHARILRELKNDPTPGESAKRAVEFCDLAHEKHRSLVLNRINQLNEQARKTLR